MKKVIESYAYQIRSAGVLLLLVITLLNCGDTTGAVGEKGILHYSIHTDYEMDKTLTEAVLLTNVTHTIRVWHQEEIPEAPNMIHTVEPSENTEIITGTCPIYDGEEAYCVPNMTLKVSDPGTYRINSVIEDEVIDTITLEFDSASTIDVITKVREPYGEEFKTAESEEIISVTKGSQVAFVPIPKASNGSRLLGDIKCEYTADPSWSVVPGKNINTAWEEGDIITRSDANFYFIEEGDMTFFITEEESGYTGEQKFSVSKRQED